MPSWICSPKTTTTRKTTLSLPTMIPTTSQDHPIHPLPMALARRAYLRSTMLIPSWCVMLRHWFEMLNSNVLQLTASPVSSSCPYWVHLRGHPIAPSFPPEWGCRLRIWELLGEGSTGAVYCARVGDTSLALKLVEILHPSDVKKRRRLHSEFRIYQHLEQAYSSTKLPERIAPQCYGLLRNKRIYALIMEMHSNALASWGDLSSQERCA